MLNRNYITSPFGSLKYSFKCMYRTSIYYLQYILLRQSKLSSTKHLYNSKKNSKAFVFANGPSFNLLDRNKVKYYMEHESFDLFAVNSFIRYCCPLIPTHYILSDPAYFNFYDKRYVNIKEMIINDLESLQKINSSIFIPIEFDKQFPYNHNCFVDSENFFSSNVFNILSPRGYLSMTAYKALAICGYLGYNEIYICGFDNNYFKTLEVSSNNEIILHDYHFYNTKTKDTVLKMDWEPSLGSFLYRDHFLFAHLEKFKTKKIINLDPNSLVDAFVKNHNLDVYTT